MKKLFIMLVVMLWSATTPLHAQNEVRGVETKLVTYYSSEKREKYFGYEFYNMNSIPVSIDAELYYRSSPNNEAILEETKSFVLDSKEKYIWKFEQNSYFLVLTYSYGNSQHPKSRPGHGSANDSYFIKYKAYKLE